MLSEWEIKSKTITKGDQFINVLISQSMKKKRMKWFVESSIRSNQSRSVDTMKTINSKTKDKVYWLQRLNKTTCHRLSRSMNRNSKGLNTSAESTIQVKLKTESNWETSSSLRNSHYRSKLSRRFLMHLQASWIKSHQWNDQRVISVAKQSPK